MASQSLIDAVQGYENYILANGIDEDVINAMVEAAKTAILSEKDEKYGLEVSKRAKELVNEYVINLTGGNIYDLDSYCNINKTNYEILNTWYEVLKLEAPYLFDSYLLYLEKNREEKNKFYFPKMEQLNKHGLIQAMQDLEDDKLDYLSISMPPGTQKCQPLYSKVLTPDGFIKMGEVEVGTKVIAGSGKIATVLGTSPVNVRKIYELTFDDGSKTRCSDNHLWKVQTRDDRRRKNEDGSEKYRVIELSQMLKNYKVENGKRCNYSVDYVPMLEFSKKDFLIHPYVMGVLLGDGGISQAGQIITTKDNEMIDKVNELLPNGYMLKYKVGYDYRIAGHEGNNAKAGSIITKELKKYGLQGKTSIEKFVPRDYLYCEHEQRLWLLRGLMDTDGSATENYCVFATISRQLAYDVCELVHSLGGYVSVNERKSGYKKDGKYIKCNNYYELIIEFANGMEDIFYLTRKKEKYRPKRKQIKRYITDIKFVGEEECKCIYIDDETHLYITDDYIITHNTTLEKFFSSWIIGKHPSDYSLFFSHSSDITRMFYDGVLDITTSDEYTWSEIFPDVKLRDTNAKAEKMDFGKYKPFYSLQCTSVGSKNSGKVRCNRYLYCDDLIGGIEEAMNRTRLDTLWNLYSVDARQRKLNEQVKEIHIATRWSVHDVIGRLKNLYGHSERARFIAIPDIDPATGESNFNYKYNGMSTRFFEEQALVMDDVSYRCLYKNEPIEREGLLFPEDKIRRYLNLPHGQSDIVTAQCDTKGKGTDYFVMPVFQKYGDDYYCVDCVCDNTADYELQYENASNLIVGNQVQECEFERNAGGDRVAMEVNKRVENKGWICNITDVPTETNKEARIYQCSNWILQHVIFKDKSLYTAKEPYGVMMSLLMQYSVSGKKQLDDVPDVFSNFAIRVTKGARRKPTVIMEGFL